MTVASQSTGMLNALVNSARIQVPSGVMREYWVWALSKQNPYQELWIQMIGIPQFEHLTAFLLEDVVENDHVASLDALASMMNVYLLYETLSDNFAIGCARPSMSDQNIFDREDILLHFNDTMIEKLLHPDTDVQSMLATIQEKVQALSLFEHSLSREKQQKHAHVFAKSKGNASIDAIEYGGWSMLVANIEAAASALSLINSSLNYSLVRDNLVRRYDGVNKLLNTKNHSYDDLLRIGASTILVPAVLAFYFSAIAELKHNQHFNQAIQSGLIQAVMDDAALLIRLLNDIGPALLLNNEQMEVIIADLYHLSTQMEDSTSVFELVADLAEKYPEMTRIKKDLDYNEFNVLLDSIGDSDYTQSVYQIEHVLRSSATLYARLTKRLQKNVAELSAQLNDDAYGKIALRFVGFHEKLYMHDYQLNKGEYAV